MSNLHKLRLYTMQSCTFCVDIKSKLDKWGYEYEEINITEQPEHKAFLKENGHTTVPTLYWGKVHLNPCDTRDFTEEHITSQFDRYVDKA